jgi:hypothetical protein
MGEIALVLSPPSETLPSAFLAQSLENDPQKVDDADVRP